MSNSKIVTYGVLKEKEPDELVFPNNVGLEELIKSLLYEFVNLKAGKVLDFMDEAGISTSRREFEHENTKLWLQELGMMSYEEMAKLVDLIKGTKTSVDVDKGTARVIRGPDHNGVGFYPITSGSMVKFTRDGEEKEGSIAMPALDEDGCVEVYVEDEGEFYNVDPIDLWRV